MLKNLSGKSEQLLLKLFNDCLQQGVYPWNSSITTPLHKKGDRQNPDNYRAITVGSCLGKLFSSLLLARLLDFRETMCPDYPNQLGFRSGAQCSARWQNFKKWLGMRKYPSEWLLYILWANLNRKFITKHYGIRTIILLYRRNFSPLLLCPKSKSYTSWGLNPLPCASETGALDHWARNLC